MVTNTPIGVFRAIVILPSCLDFMVVHRLLRQTSTCRDHGRNEPGDCGLCLDGQTVSYEHELEQVLAAAQSRVPESPVPATSGGAENMALSVTKLLVWCCAEIYSIWCLGG